MKNQTRNQESVANCDLCGVCNLSCPIYSVLMKESAGPRFKAFLSKKGDYKDLFFLCTNCKSCMRNCPAGIDINCLEIRRELAEKGFQTPRNKEMRENIKLTGNAYGKTGKGKKIKTLFT